MTVKQIIFYQLVEGETVVHVCKCPGDMAVRMHKVQAIINQGVRSMLPCFLECPNRPNISKKPGSLSYEQSTEPLESKFYSCPCLSKKKVYSLNSLVSCSVFQSIFNLLSLTLNLYIINFCFIHSLLKLMLSTVFLYGWITLLIICLSVL